MPLRQKVTWRGADTTDAAGDIDTDMPLAAPTGDTSDIDLPIDASTQDEAGECLNPYEGQISYEYGAESAYWSKYSSNYYYNQLTSGQKSLWDVFYAECMTYLTTNTDTYAYDSDTAKTQTIYYSNLGISQEQARTVIRLFRYSNPQFFFLNNSSFLDSDQAALGVYPEFKSGSARIKAANKTQDKLDQWLKEVDLAMAAYSGSDRTVATEMEVTDLICDNVDYVNCKYDQSLYSIIDSGNSVCNGYSKLCEALLNAEGITNVMVTSASHAWNLVKVNGTWFTVDVTWMDQESYISRKGFNTSQAAIDASYGKGENTHMHYESFYSGLTPSSVTDWHSSYTNRAAAPSLSTRKSGDTIYVIAASNASNDASGIRYSIYTGSLNIGVGASSSVGFSAVMSLSISQGQKVNVKDTKSGYADSRIVTYDAGAYNTVAIYRLYCPVNGEHLYTTDANEKNVLSTQYGWSYEGIGWYSTSSGTPVYRLYNSGLKNHLYTSDLNECQTLVAQDPTNWHWDNNGNPVFYSGGSIPVYRVYNRDLQGMHHLTTDYNEYVTLPAYGWKQEGVSFYAASK